MTRTMFSRVLPLFLLVSIGASTCYYPNGDLDSESSPCDPKADVSVCCAVGFQCLSNGLCADYRYPDWARVLRGGCTDGNWSDKCGTVCLDVWSKGDAAVTYCGGDNWCCDGFDGKDCCNSTTVALLTLSAPSIVATAKSTSSRRVFSTASSTTATESTAAPNPADAKKGSKNNIAIGVGVGVAVGVLLFIGLFAACFFIQRKKRLQRQNNEVRGGTEREVGSDTISPVEDDALYDARGNRIHFDAHGNRIQNQTTGLVGTANSPRNVRKSWGQRIGGRKKGDVVELSAEKVHELPADREAAEVHGRPREETKVEQSVRYWAR